MKSLLRLVCSLGLSLVPLSIVHADVPDVIVQAVGGYQLFSRGESNHTLTSDLRLDYTGLLTHTRQFEDQYFGGTTRARFVGQISYAQEIPSSVFDGVIYKVLVVGTLSRSRTDGETYEDLDEHREFYGIFIAADGTRYMWWQENEELNNRMDEEDFSRGEETFDRFRRISY